MGLCALCIGLLLLDETAALAALQPLRAVAATICEREAQEADEQASEIEEDGLLMTETESSDDGEVWVALMNHESSEDEGSEGAPLFSESEAPSSPLKEDDNPSDDNAGDENEAGQQQVGEPEA